MFNLKTTVIATVASLVIGIATGWSANGWRLNAKIDRLMSEQSQALVQASKEALIESARLQKVKDDALNVANDLAQKNADAANLARTELERLRLGLADSTSIARATCASTRNRATALSIVFEQCATRLTEVAKEADQHAVDSRTCHAAWPASR